MLSGAAISSFATEISKIAAKQQETLPKADIKEIKREVELWNKLRAMEPKVKIKIDRDAEAYGGAYFDQQAKMIGLTRKDYESLAHELGHVEMDKKFLGRLMQHPISRSAFEATPIAAILGGVLLAKGKKLGLLLPIATATPTLLSEWLVTRKGGKKLELVGASKKEIDKYKKNLKASFKTYSSVIPKALLATGAGVVAGSL